jgi:hypothetical protein
MNATLSSISLLFQIGWFACVLGAAYGHAVAGSGIARRSSCCTCCARAAAPRAGAGSARRRRSASAGTARSWRSAGCSAPAARWRPAPGAGLDDRAVAGVRHHAQRLAALAEGAIRCRDTPSARSAARSPTTPVSSAPSEFPIRPWRSARRASAGVILPLLLMLSQSLRRHACRRSQGGGAMFDLSVWMTALAAILPAGGRDLDPERRAARRRHRRQPVVAIVPRRRAGVRRARPARCAARRRGAGAGGAVGAAAVGAHHLARLGRAGGPPLPGDPRAQPTGLRVQEPVPGVRPAGPAGLGRHPAAARGDRLAAAARPAGLRRHRDRAVRHRLRERRRLAVGALQGRPRQPRPGAGHRPVAPYPSSELLRRVLRVVGLLR